PPNWIKVRFDEIAENITDRIDKPNESGLEYYIGLEHIDTDQIRIKKFGSTEDVKATKFLCKKGDIIFGKRRSYLRKVAITDRDAVVSAHSMVIRPKGDLIVPEFLPCFMQSSVFWKTAHAISEGSMSPTIKWKTMAKQEFWIPTIEEQKKTSEVLWSIEDTIEKSEFATKKVLILKDGLLDKLLDQGIGPKKYKNTKIGKIPEDWNVYGLFETGEYINGKAFKPSEWKEEGTTIIRIQNLTNIDSKFNYYNGDIKEKYIVQKGDLLFPWSASINVYIWKGERAYLNQHIYKIIPNGGVDKKFLYYMLLKQIKHMEKISHGTTMKHITKKNLEKMMIPIPTLDEQYSIVKILEILDTMIEKQIDNLDKLQVLKKKLTNEFISGKLIIPKEVL
ncbi:MAG: restriction endonuclease subunit S, partial [ANME-2 cluster archaeon]